MKEKILEEAMQWYKKQDDHPDVYIGDFVDLVIHKTTDAIFEEIENELKQEFANGNLKQPFIISSDYYLELKLKEIKDKVVKSPPSEDSIVEEK
ncbi:unnamed protein product [marine sediment metagenome]|uniref:Uncharacterized protein n=1 Tax=marine sediment metagenome TaxID=412755 RepID=X1AD48_9ZZZZ